MGETGRNNVDHEHQKHRREEAALNKVANNVNKIIQKKDWSFEDKKEVLKKKFYALETHGLNADDLHELFFLSRHRDKSIRAYVGGIAATVAQSGKYPDEFAGFLLTLIGENENRRDALESLQYDQRSDLLYLYGGLLIQDSDELVRVQASENLAGLNEPAVRPFLEAGLEDKSVLVRFYCAYGLGLVRAKESESRLVALQKADGDIQVRAACWAALFLITTDEAWLDKMIGLLNHENDSVCQNVINYLSDAIEMELIEADTAIKAVNEVLETEERLHIAEDMKEFLAKYWDGSNQNTKS